MPIAIAANCVRIIGTGLLVQNGYPDAAQGASHETWGVIVFVLALRMLYILHALVRRLFPEKGGTSSTPRVATATAAFPGGRNSSPRFIVTALLIAAAAIFLQTRARGESSRLVVPSPNFLCN